MSEQRFRRVGGPGAGVIAARPGLGTGGPAGELPIGLGNGRDGLLYVPRGVADGRLAGLAVMLHGAGGDASEGIGLLAAVADDADLIVLAPESRRQSWDVIAGGYGPDVTFIDQALALVFSRYSINPRRLAIGGFSDGASYALSLGIMNGTLFSHIIAFSPGFMAPLHQEGYPRIFISHGQADDVLPIDECSRRLVTLLEGAGYELRYREFPGGHSLPPAIVREAVSWLIS